MFPAEEISGIKNKKTIVHTRSWNEMKPHTVRKDLEVFMGPSGKYTSLL